VTNRTVFIIDGFNLYHSAKQASKDLGLGEKGTKWLDIRSLCASYLHIVGSNAQLGKVYYFSALATHLEAAKPHVTARHRSYIEALEANGVTVELSRFKDKEVRCPYCGKVNIRHEEKETDVAVAAKVLELFATDECETVVLVTGDTDVAPAVRTAARLYPQKRVCFAFPYRRKNKELSQLVKTSFNIKKEAYARFQFADPLVLPNGNSIAKPASW